jgi:hypothetical protein
MSGHEGLTRKQQQAITALLTATSLEAAATQIGVVERTLRRWQQLPAFRAALAAARREVMEGAILLAQRASKAAVVALVRNLKHDKGEVVNAAAKIILDQGFRGIELMDLAGRVAELEGRQHEHGNPESEGGTLGTDSPGGIPPEAEPTAGGDDA